MLSSQTKDQVTAKAMTKLREHGLTIDNVMLITESTLADMISPVGFYRVSLYCGISSTASACTCN